MLVVEDDVTTNAAQATKKATIEAALAQLESDFGIVVSPAVCGDGVVDDGSVPGDPNRGEQCDPPDGGVTCDANCQTVP
jgi:hypothetical protein